MFFSSFSSYPLRLSTCFFASGVPSYLGRLETVPIASSELFSLCRISPAASDRQRQRPTKRNEVQKNMGKIFEKNSNPSSNTLMNYSVDGWGRNIFLFKFVQVRSSLFSSFLPDCYAFFDDGIRWKWDLSSGLGEWESKIGGRSVWWWTVCVFCGW